MSKDLRHIPYAQSVIMMLISIKKFNNINNKIPYKKFQFKSLLLIFYNSDKLKMVGFNYFSILRIIGIYLRK